MFSGEVQLFANSYLDTGTVQQHPLGTKGVTPDGRVFRYAENGAVALTRGQLCVAATQVANHANIAVQAAAAVGVTSVTVTLGATLVAANDYADGFLVVNDEAGEGIAYRISGHPAAAANGNLVVSLVDPIEVALTVASEVSLVRNPWKDIVISVTDQLDLPVGVPVINIAANAFGWVQTRGVCSGLADETLAVGVALTTGTGVAGALEALDAAGEPQVGVALQAGVDTEYRAVYLTID